jgi:3-carboxy-cis,cis-muconate cycloisomerase
MTDPLFPSSLLAPLYSTAEMRAVLDDRARLQRMLDFEAALARAEAAVGIVPASHGGTIADACQSKLYDLAALAEGTAVAGNLAIPLVNALTAEVGRRNKKAAAYVHWGATSQDVIDTAMVLELRAVIDTLFHDLDRATKAFIALAGRHRRNMTVARTLLQQAVPMPFGLKLAGYAAALARSRDRLRRLRKDSLVVQFGGAAGTLAALGEKGLDVSERLAALLDLAVPDAPWHTHRDRFAEIASAFAILAGTCGKIARDVILLMQSEVAEAFEPAAAGRGGSSTLPQKRDPVGAAAALSAAMIAPNLAATVLNAQFQEHERSVGGWQSEWVTFPALALVVSGTLRAVAEIAEGLTVDVERMKANLEASGGLVLAEAVSFALAEKLGRSEAHELVAELTREAAKSKRPFKDVVADSPKIKPHLSANELDRLFMPNHYQGSAQTFIDRLVASSQGRGVRRSSSVAHLTDPKLPTARAEHLANLRAATQAAKKPAAPKPVVTEMPAEPVEQPVTLIEPPAAAEPPAAEQIPAVATNSEIAAAHSNERLGQAVEAASALIAQTISELTRPTSVSAAAALPPVEPPAPEPETPDSADEEPPVAVEAEPVAAAEAEPAMAEAAPPESDPIPPAAEPESEPEPAATAQTPAATADEMPVEPVAEVETEIAEVASETVSVVAEETAAEEKVDDQPGALLDLFARAAENENAPPAVPERERKPA